MKIAQTPSFVRSWSEFEKLIQPNTDEMRSTRFAILTKLYCISMSKDTIITSSSNYVDNLLLCRLLVVGPVSKWLALFITVPTTCSRPSIEMVGFSQTKVRLIQ